jgi:putative transposase
LVIDSPSYRFGAYEALDLTLPALFGSFQIALIDKAPVVSYLCLILMVASLWEKKAQEWLSGRTRLSCFTCPATVRNDIEPGTLTLHADRGTSMRSKPVAALLVDLDIAKSHSRPYVSDDNPYSEAQFKTLKYRPDFPARFGCIEDARAHCQAFFAWYNAAHRHSGIGYMTPHNVHHGQAEQLRGVRQAVLDEAFLATPNRFKGRRPEPHALPTAVWINPPSPETINPKSQQPCAVNS